MADDEQNVAKTQNDDTQAQTKGGAEMSFWQHLDEFRGVLFRVALLVIVLAIGAFYIMRQFFDNVILAPCSDDFPTYHLLSFIHGDGDFLPDLGVDNFSVSLMTINMGSQFMTHLTSSLWLAATVAFPLILWMLWRYVSPALYLNERRPARRAFLSGLALFYVGVLVGYFFVFPLALRFLSQYQLSPDIAVNLTLDSYMDTFYMILLSMGIVFEIPVLAWMLGKIGLLKRSFFSRYRRHAIVICAAVGSIITPTSDVFTLILVFVPIYGLWELSALLVPRAVPQND